MDEKLVDLIEFSASQLSSQAHDLYASSDLANRRERDRLHKRVRKVSQVLSMACEALNWWQDER